MSCSKFRTAHLEHTGFEIDRPAGSGGIGTVYRVRDRYSDEWAALKLWHLDRLGPDKVRRFTGEVRVLAELHRWEWHRQLAGGRFSSVPAGPVCP